MDLLIKNAKHVDGSLFDIGIKDGKIVDPESSEPARLLNLKGESYVSAGWIDSHVHCYENMELYTDYPDEIGIKCGVTTIVDAGSSGCANIGDFHRLATVAKTNVYAFMNISQYGIVAQNELSNLANIRVEAARETVAQYPDFIVGFKARMSKTVVGENGIKPLHLAKEIQQGTNRPLMVHIGSEPPTLAEIVDVMEAGDIMTHCFNGKPNGVRSESGIKATAKDAYDKGIVFDIGHGTDSFNFEVAEMALKEGMKAQLISTDIYIRNRLNGPVFDLATTMEKLLAIGYSFEEVIEKVTIEPAKALNFPKKGRLEVGADADLTIFKVVTGEKRLVDSNQNERLGTVQIVPEMAMVGGELHECG